MVKLMSFKLSGEFGAFKDPSVTTNQIVYFAPSKSALIGLLAAIIGIERQNSLSEDYTSDYKELFRKTSIGIECLSWDEKVHYFTNHRSFKEAKMRPFKSELLMNPKYNIFVRSDDGVIDKINTAISNHNPVFPPYLGHAYCPARLDDAIIYNSWKPMNTTEFETISVVIEEGGNHNGASIEMRPIDQNSSLIIEKHLHHFFSGDKMEARVLKYWIPVGGSRHETIVRNQSLSSQVTIDGETAIQLF